MSGDGSLVVVDSSVVAKWLIPERDTDEALALRERHRFAVPDILFAEVANILWKHVARGTIDARNVEEAMSALAYFKPHVLHSQQIFSDACRLAVELNHPAYDCFYLLTAARFGTVMVTADDRLLRKLASTAALEWSPLVLGLAEAGRF